MIIIIVLLIQSLSRGKAGSALYDDLDQPHLPSCLAASVVEWKRPAQFFQDKDGQSELVHLHVAFIYLFHNRYIQYGTRYACIYIHVHVLSVCLYLESCCG